MAARAHSELQEHQIKLGELDTNLRREALSSQATVNEMKAFKESLAILLSEGFSSMPTSEEAIKERIRQLVANQQGSKQVPIFGI